MLARKKLERTLEFVTPNAPPIASFLLQAGPTKFEGFVRNFGRSNVDSVQYLAEAVGIAGAERALLLQASPGQRPRP